MNTDDLIKFLMLPKEEQERILNGVMEVTKLVLDWIRESLDKMVEDKKNGE